MKQLYGKDIIVLNNVRYKVLEYLGEGSSFCVHKARSEKDNRQVIIKEYYPINSQGDDFTFNVDSHQLEYDGANVGEWKNKILRSENNIRQFNHFIYDSRALNHISQIEMIREDNGTLYLLQEIQNGITMDKWKPKSLQSVLEAICEIARIVKAFHDEGRIIMDLKPSNLFIIDETKMIIKLIDFDSIIEEKELKEYKAGDTIRLGSSKGYIAPEVQAVYDALDQLEEEGEEEEEKKKGKIEKLIHQIDGRVDVFALGKILNIYSKIFQSSRIIGFQADDITLLEFLQTTTKSIIAKSLDENLELRYFSINDFIKDFNILAGICRVNSYRDTAKQSSDYLYKSIQNTKLKELENISYNLHLGKILAKISISALVELEKINQVVKVSNYTTLKNIFSDFINENQDYYECHLTSLKKIVLPFSVFVESPLYNFSLLCIMTLSLICGVKPRTFQYYASKIDVSKATSESLCIQWFQFIMCIYCNKIGSFKKALSFGINTNEMLSQKPSYNYEKTLNHINMAYTYIKTDDYSNALPHLLTSINLFASVKEDSINFASCLYWLGKCYMEIGLYDPAIHSFRQALDSFNSMGSQKSADIAQCNYWIGVSMFEIGEFKEAIYHFILSYSYYHDVANELICGYLQYSIGYCMYKILRYDDAISAFDNALAHYQNLIPNNSVGLFSHIYKCHYRLGRCYFQKSDFKQAKIYFSVALNIIQSQNTDAYTNQVHEYCIFWIGRCEYGLTKFTDALDNFREVAALFLKYEKKDLDYALCMYWVGRCHLDIKNYPAAESPLLTSYGIYQKYYKGKELLEPLYCLGICYYSMQKYESTIDYLKTYINVANENMLNTYISGRVNFLLADSFYNINNYENAKEYIKNAIDIYRKKEDMNNYYYSKYLEAKIYFQSNDYCNTIRILKEVILFFDNNTRIPFDINMYYILGVSYYHTSNYPEAEKTFETALKACKYDKNGNLGNYCYWLAKTNIALKRKRMAIAYLKRALHYFEDKKNYTMKELVLQTMNTQQELLDKLK